MKRVHRHDVFPVSAFELMYVDGIVIFFVFPSDIYYDATLTEKEGKEVQIHVD